MAGIYVFELFLIKLFSNPIFSDAADLVKSKLFDLTWSYNFDNPIVPNFPIKELDFDNLFRPNYIAFPMILCLLLFHILFPMFLANDKNYFIIIIIQLFYNSCRICKIE